MWQQKNNRKYQCEESRKGKVVVSFNAMRELTAAVGKNKVV